MADHWRTSRSDLRGVEHLTGSPHGAGGTRAASVIPFPQGSIRPADPAFELSQVPQSPVNKSAACIDALFGAITGVGLVIAGLILLFVQV